MSKPEVCPAEENAVAYVQGELAAGDAAEFERHMDRCAACRGNVESARRVIAALESVPAGEKTGDLAPGILAKIPESEWARARKPVSFRFPLPLPFYARAAAAVLIAVTAGFLVLRFWGSGTESERVAETPAATAGPGAVQPAAPQGKESAIASGLAWLLRAQEADGSWDAGKWGAPKNHTVGVTALSLLALLADKAGTPGADAAIAKASAYLMGRQAASGALGPECANSMYNHGIATVALIKASNARHGTDPAAMSNALSRAVQFICSAQQEGGGWGYGATGATQPNTSVSVWQLQALLAARDSGRGGLDGRIKLAADWLGGMVDGSGNMGYSMSGQAPAAPVTLTAAGLLCLAANDPALQDNRRVGEMVAALQSDASVQADRPDYYRSYFVTHALRMTDGDSRKTIDRIEGSLIACQTRNGPSAGSWEIGDQWTSAGGLIYNTSMAVLSLE